MSPLACELLTYNITRTTLQFMGAHFFLEEFHWIFCFSEFILKYYYSVLWLYIPVYNWKLEQFLSVGVSHILKSEIWRIVHLPHVVKIAQCLKHDLWVRHTNTCFWLWRRTRRQSCRWMLISTYCATSWPRGTQFTFTPPWEDLKGLMRRIWGLKHQCQNVWNN